MQKKQLLIGAHTSTQGGLFRALLEGQSIGATTVQIFTANQRRWQGKAITEGDVAKWEEALEETRLSSIMSHASYLINLGAPDPINLKKSRAALKEELERCRLLGITYLNIHPGAALDRPRGECLDRIIDSLLSHEELIGGKPTTLLLETTAGQGSCVGARFEEIAYILSRVKKRIAIGVCLDTCHSFAAGYDLRTKEAVDATLKEFDRVIGLTHLKAFHMNDSLASLGSRKDRHMPLGKGQIGLECFRTLMQDKRTRLLPKYLETPEGPSLWKKEIALLRSFA